MEFSFTCHGFCRKVLHCLKPVSFSDIAPIPNDIRIVEQRADNGVVEVKFLVLGQKKVNAMEVSDGIH